MEITLENGKTLQHDEKSFSDTNQLVKDLESFSEFYERMKDDLSEKTLGLVSNIFIKKGSIIHLELIVEDSFLSNMLYKWMYNDSNYDGKSGLRAFGCTLRKIEYTKDEDYEKDVKLLVKKLYDKVFEK